MAEAATEATPLVGDATPTTADPNGKEPPPLQEMKAESTKEKLVAGAAAVGFGTSMAAMLVETNPSVYVSGVIGCAVAPYSVIQQQKLTQTEALRQTNERIEHEVSVLKEENIRLQTQVQSLNESVENLKHMSQTLQTIRAMEGQSITALEEQLEESRQIYANMQDNLESDILQGIVDLMESVEDGDGQLSDDEIDKLIVRIEGLHGIDLKNDMLKEYLVSKGRGVGAMLDVAKTLLDDATPTDESFFRFLNKEGEDAAPAE